MHRTLNDDDVYIIHPEKKHIVSRIGSKNVRINWPDKPEGHKNFQSYVDYADKKHGIGHVATFGRNIKDQNSFKHLQEETNMDKHQAPFSYIAELAKDFAPKGPEQLNESNHDDGTPKSSGNAFDFKAFLQKKREAEGTNLRNHEKQKTATGTVYKRKEDAPGADTKDTKPEEKRGRGRPAGVYGSYKKKIKEAIEAHSLDQRRN
jgi:hypothetical protein